MSQDPMPIDFATLSPPDSPNTWLIAPPGTTKASADAPAPVFDVSAAALIRAWIRIVEDQSRTRIVAVSDDGLQVEAEQRSAVFGFVDKISARAYPLDGDRSTLAAYSRSMTGYWDFGINRRRLEAWIAALQDEIGAPLRN